MDQPTARRWIVALSGLALLATACGGGATDTSSAPSATAAPTPPAAATTGPETSASPSRAAAAPAGDAAAAPVTIADDLGAVEVPAAVTRVVTTSDETTELLVALGIEPVGIASTRVDTTAAGDERFDDYYLSEGQLGDAAFVGGESLNFEAIAALEPDLIVHGGQDDSVDVLRDIAATAVYDIQVPGAWQTALTQLGEATGTAEQATRIIADYERAVDDAAAELEPVVEQAPRLSVIYPNYRGGDENFVFDAEFALAAVVPALGFELVGAETAEAAFPGVFAISPERYPDLAAVTDTIVAVSTEDWRDTPSATVLSAVDVPVVGVLLDEGRPSTGPLSAPAYLESLTAGLVEQYRGS